MAVGMQTQGFVRQVSKPTAGSIVEKHALMGWPGNCSNLVARALTCFRMDSRPANSTNHRASPRQRALKAAKVILDDWSAIDCLIRNVSETGAQIKTSGAISLPHKFKLLMVADNTIRLAQVTRKLNDTMGVVFLGPAEKATMRKYVPPNF
jgi:hypothetical protein